MISRGIVVYQFSQIWLILEAEIWQRTITSNVTSALKNMWPKQNNEHKHKYFP